VGIILIGFSLLTVIAGGQLSAAVRADFDQRLQNSVRLIARGISGSLEDWKDGRINTDQLATVFKEYETQIGGKLAFYPAINLWDATGIANIMPRVVSFRNMPELEQAMRGGNAVIERPNAAGESTLYTGAMASHDRDLFGLIQLAIPYQIVQSAVVQRWIALALAFILVTSLALVAALWLSQSITRPLYTLRESALRLSRGDFSQRINSTGKDEIGEVAHAFDEMADQVQSMLEEQRAFASNTSHELRTPLTAIRLRTEALRYETMDAETTKHYIEEIDDEIVRLGNLVQDLTLLSRFDAGRAELGADEIDFSRLASNLCHQVADLAREKQIQVVLHPAPTPVFVKASLSHLTVVFRNLLDNALKYTPTGGVITWMIATDAKMVIHTLQDTGRGIAAEDLPHLYERFFRADRAHTRDIPGTGLGLALVKSILDAYHAQITITSAGLGKGTCVEVRWPVETSAIVAAETAADATAKS
jgi:signal transduction histidine kinase